MAGIFELLMEVAVSSAQVTSSKRAWIELTVLLSAVILLLVLAFVLIGHTGAFAFLDTRRWL